ncbi:hypothetical protein BN2475_1370003 [Paraburkholderia ribeironis]|uniref:Uncharacterized protein n=1 Tax=Paraburkholderia ribeironis TaxID=1247936 RepID=A0A1N7SQX0_9BURK|nr:hypothetical protein [Paraburkholderia ribeironis]SIT49337.1 hypothetical protein BN2475_1370003 [Paraburkholderia ribeironis]
MTIYSSNESRRRYQKSWLESIQRVDGRLCAITTSKDGIKNQIALDGIRKIHLPPHASRSVNFHTNTGDWEVEDSRRYLEACGYPADAAGMHDVFRVKADGREMLIPALALIKALFKQHLASYRHLYHPTGLESLCRPVEIAGNKAIELSLRLGHRSTPDHMFDLLRWIYYFPSARATWNSVYRAALAGKCSIALPKANLRVAVTGEPRARGTIILANLLTVGNIEALEEPYEWAGDQPRFLTREFAKGRLESELAVR